jgi:general L-amino acid transport system permease protein
MLVQVVFAVVVVGCGWLLLTTMLANLRQQGIPISFAFLRQAAGFAISEGPAFDPSQSYLTAFGVGVVNTLRVAVAGVLLATLLGLCVGLARLSRNWLLARLATAYVETFRNVPLLLWLVFTYATLRETLPRLRQSLSLLGGNVLLSNRGIALSWLRTAATFHALFPWLVAALGIGLVVWLWTRRATAHRSGYGAPRTAFWRGCVATAVICMLGFLVTWATAHLPIGTAVDQEARVAYLDLNQNGLWDEDEPSLAGIRVILRGADDEVSTLTRGDGSFALSREPTGIHHVATSAAAPLFWSKPRIQGFNYGGGLVLSPEFAALLIGLVIYTAAFIAEIVRAGVQAVHRGQREAAKALGLSEAQTFRLIILPQALRVMIPPLINQYLNLTKNSSLAIAVGYPDLFSVGLTINNQTGQAIPFVIMIMVMYLSMSLLTSLALNLLNKRLALKT